MGGWGERGKGVEKGGRGEEKEIGGWRGEGEKKRKEKKRKEKKRKEKKRKEKKRKEKKRKEKKRKEKKRKEKKRKTLQDRFALHFTHSQISIIIIGNVNKGRTHSPRFELRRKGR